MKTETSSCQLIRSFLTAAAFALALAGCGGGGSSGSSTSSTTSGNTSNTTSGYYTRTTGGTAMYLNGASSYWCAWDSCPGGVTCGVKVYGNDLGTTQAWQIPNGNGTFLTDIFTVTQNNPGFTLTYQGSRVGDYLPAPANSWASATQGDTGGYCSGTGTTTPAPTPAPTTGQIAVYTTRATTQTGSTTVTIDNVTAGSLTTYYTSAPTCGASGTVTKTLSVGSHTLSAADGTLTWGPTTFSITAGGCVTFALN